jgi:hypothetical protein
MNFDEAIYAHSEWKLKLSAYLRKPDGSITPADIAPDNRCQLGKWIHGDGAQFSSLEAYDTLLREHARFHRAAADVVRRADAGENAKEDTLLGAHSEFSASSNAIVMALMTMRLHTQAK